MAARILVIEDNKDNLELVTYLLAAFGHTVFIAEDGAEGVDVAVRELPDLIICDLQMPRLDGYEVARILRQDQRFSQRPLIAVTSFAMRGDRERVLAAGFDGYISKPIAPDEFASQVEQYLTSRSAPHPAAEHQGDRSQPARTSFHTTVLAVDNSPINLRLIESTLEPFGYKVISTSSVREALAQARENPPNVVLSDLHMPDEDGFDLFRAMSADPQLKTIPFAIFSATFHHDTDLDEARREGVQFFIQRPIEPVELIARLEACLASSRSVPPR